VHNRRSMAGRKNPRFAKTARYVRDLIPNRTGSNQRQQEKRGKKPKNKEYYKEKPKAIWGGRVATRFFYKKQQSRKGPRLVSEKQNRRVGGLGGVLR